MRAGDLKQRIELQIPSRSQNSMGEWIDTFATQATVWGAIEPLSGNRLFLAQQANSQIQGVVRIRYRSGVVPTMKLKFGQRYFQILAIIDRDEEHKELQLFYKEIII
jgi:SPP1 family predicted phage head-tail adaptor